MAAAKRMRLGEILIQGGIIDEEKLNKALKAQTQSGGLLGEILVRMEACSDEQVAVALSKQLNIPYASRENKVLIPEAGQGLDKIISEQFARENLVLPLFQDESQVAVAMVDPTNFMTIENIKLITKTEVQTFIATKQQVLKTIDDFYGGKALLEKTMEESHEEKAPGEGGTAETGKNRVDLDTPIAVTKDTQVVAMVNAIFKQALQERCSDIHLEKFEDRVALRYRIDGELHERPAPPKSQFDSVISRLKILSNLDISERRLPQDGALALKAQGRFIDVRVSVCPTVFGEKVVMRILDKGSSKLDINMLGMYKRQQEDFLKAAESPHGLIFLTGPTGSGKTTTLYSVLQTVKCPEINIMTIEDPVEFKLEGINQVQVRANIGLTFASALRSFLRQDPDVILVGESRDKETAETCLRAALTGHLVLSTLHTNDALASVVRLKDMGLEPYLLAGSLVLVAAQRLVRVLCPKCKESYKPDRAALEAVIKESWYKPEELPEKDLSKILFYRPIGCDKCSNTGFIGRRGIYEVYKLNDEIARGIAKGMDTKDLNKIAWASGMWPIRVSGFKKVLDGVTTVDEVDAVTMAEE